MTIQLDDKSGPYQMVSLAFSVPTWSVIEHRSSGDTKCQRYHLGLLCLTNKENRHETRTQQLDHKFVLNSCPPKCNIPITMQKGKRRLLTWNMSSNISRRASWRINSKSRGFSSSMFISNGLSSDRLVDLFSKWNDFYEKMQIIEKKCKEKR